MRDSKIKPSSDAWVDQEFQAKNNGGGSRIRLSGDAAANKQRYGLIFFARPFPLGVSVVSAELHVFLKEDAWSGQHLQVQRITDDWRERKVTWNNKPGVGGSVITSGAISGNDGDEKVIDVT